VSRGSDLLVRPEEHEFLSVEYFDDFEELAAGTAGTAGTAVAWGAAGATELSPGNGQNFLSAEASDEVLLQGHPGRSERGVAKFLEDNRAPSAVSDTWAVLPAAE
jgi:hypothetical protein